MEIMGRGLRQIIRESPLYFHIGLKFAGYRFFNKKSPLYGSADIINVCNLHCEHCYWWLNRKENEDLTVEQWKKVIDEKFKKRHVFIVTVVGGEPMMRPEIVELFVKEFPKRACVVTNGTYPIPRLKDIYFYWISIDGSEKIHNEIRGDDAWAKTRKNVLDYVQNNGKKAWKDIWITMTINSKNYKTVKTVIKDWKDYSNKIGFQFHTPFMKGDPLWLPFGKERDQVIDDILEMFWLIDGKTAFGGRAALIPLFKTIFSRKLNKNQKINVEESCDAQCKTAKAVFVRSASLLTNSKKISL